MVETGRLSVENAETAVLARYRRKKFAWEV
jgi:hypothetical protein